MSMACQSRALRPDGNHCPEIGDRTGRATLTWMAKPCLSKSPPVTGELSPATTWHLGIGSLDKHLKVVSFRVCHCWRGEAI
ncbi:hypothetical protein V6N12_062309 [Hibiscus sabdariffa]|uniref:Uncharacterized protein n=1 Tax=Hibiscus sabdariffa TaxID=183260 RepID=A0ABR2F8G1_9ROSI